MLSTNSGCCCWRGQIAVWSIVDNHDFSICAWECACVAERNTRSLLWSHADATKMMCVFSWIQILTRYSLNECCKGKLRARFCPKKATRNRCARRAQLRRIVATVKPSVSEKLSSSRLSTSLQILSCSQTTSRVFVKFVLWHLRY